MWAGGFGYGQGWGVGFIKGIVDGVGNGLAEAVQAFDAAIQGNPKESKGARLYGMRYGYFPHRDKGIAL